MGLEEIELRHRWLTLEVYKWREKKARIADGVNRTKQIVLGMRSGSARQYVPGKYTELAKKGKKTVHVTRAQ